MLCFAQEPLVGSTSEAMAAAAYASAEPGTGTAAGLKGGCPLSALADDTNCATVDCSSTSLVRSGEKSCQLPHPRSELRLVCATKRVEVASAAFPNGMNVPRCRTGVKKRCGWPRRFPLFQALIGEWSRDPGQLTTRPELVVLSNVDDCHSATDPR